MKSRKLICLAVLILFAPAVMASDTLFVNGVSGNDGDTCTSPTTACKTIGHAIALAASGDTVMVSAATYYTEALTVSLNLNLIGAGATATIIDGRASGTVITISNTTAHVTLSNLTIRNGKASSGAGIKNSGTLTLSNSTVTGNWAPIPCHPLFLVCLVFGTAYGGGIYNSGVLTISNSTITGNQAGGYCNGNPCSAFGGGIFNNGTLAVKSSTLNGNIASTACRTGGSCQVGQGGAFYTYGSTVTLNNSTITENRTYRCSGTCGGTGGAIVNGSGTFAMNNSTVSGNSAGGIVNDGTATLQNSIVDNNAGINCRGTITSHGYNLSSDDTCKLSGPGDLNNHDPLVGPLQNNGGPTQTMALLPGSPAIDAGNPSGCTDGHGHLLTTDQRGMPRPDREDKLGCDLGAYERQSD